MKDIRSSKQLLVNFFGRYHLVIFVVIVVLLLSIAILILSGVVGKASGMDLPNQNTTSSTFDEETIERIKRLKTSDQPSETLDFSRGRINPFSE